MRDNGKQKEKWVARAALIVSAISAIVSLSGIVIARQNTRYQARISQFPAVSVYFRWDVPVPEPNQEPYSTVQWKIENTGTGPGVVHSAKLVANTGESYDLASSEAWEELRDLLTERVGSEIIGYDIETIAPGYAIAAGAEWPLFEVSFRNTNEEDLKSAKEVANIAVCHCSIASGECHSDDSDANPDNTLIEDCPKNVDIAELLRKS